MGLTMPAQIRRAQRYTSCGISCIICHGECGAPASSCCNVPPSRAREPQSADYNDSRVQLQFTTTTIFTTFPLSSCGHVLGAGHGLDAGLLHPKPGPAVCRCPNHYTRLPLLAAWIVDDVGQQSHAYGSCVEG
eukprot:366069-Chlamydomonas_euryale.AAC.5